MDHLIMLLSVCLAALMVGCSVGPARLGSASPVRVQRADGAWTLMRDGRPYTVRGAGGGEHLERLAEAGGNSVRTWDGEGIDDLLDQAHTLGLTVTVGIWLEHERHGFDYADPASKQRQLAKVRRIVNTYKDHPAVLLWGVGNEVELGGDLDKAMIAIEDAAALIKTLDPDHPTMAVIAEIGDEKVVRLREACPSIDLVGINSYGGAASIPDRLTEQGYDGPYIVTEFGPRGHWEGPHTPWGAPIEPTSAEKTRMYEQSYRAAVSAEMPGRCLGSYVFLWGQKQETTATWFGMFLESGEALPTVDVMHRMWTGSDPENSAPVVGRIDAKVSPNLVLPGARFDASAEVTDPDGDELNFRWAIIAESTDRKTGGDAEQAPPEIPGSVVSASGPTAVIKAPEEPGAYRLFVFAFDGEGGAGTANLPFLVKRTDR